MSKPDRTSELLKSIDENLKSVNANLSVVRRLLELQLRGPIKNQLEALASTPERKKIWTLCDGTLNTSEIAEKVSVSQRAVQYFLQECSKQGLVGMTSRGTPYRMIDWIPPDWAVVMERPQKETQGRAEVNNQ